MFFSTENLVSQTIVAGLPWEFVPTEKIGAQVRGNKEDRQAWYNNPSTKHCFYTGIEPTNPNIRPGKTNPPRFINAFCADYDAKISDERVDEAVASMKIKPAWVERSLGGNIRLVWTLAHPLPVDDYSFCSFVLESAAKWLQLDLLPALDEPAFLSPSRLLCNGCAWRATGHPAIPAAALQAFFVKCGKGFRFSQSSETEIPLDVIEAECKRLFPSFDWPGDFMLESQGPTFWLPESVSPLSAILKPNGIFTFSAHATKPFYTWADILGPEFVKNFVEASITKATLDIWWDNRRFWRKINSLYDANGKEEILNYLVVNCGLTNKPTKAGPSSVELALNHIFNQNRVKGAAPFVFRPAGPIYFQGERMLNTYVNRPIAPAVGKQVWGPQGNFPFLSMLLDNLYDPPTQLMHWLAWFQYYYRCALENTPMPGQNMFMMGGVGIGKTYVNREVVGTAVGGYVDASDYLVEGVTFNSHLMYKPHWCLDDDTPADSARANARLHAVFKKTAANQQVLSTQKFEHSVMVEWAGRIGCTTNLDHVSSRIVGPMDNNSLDKTSLFRCSASSKIKFPTRADMNGIAARELPFLLRWLLDWQVPDEVLRDSRYGFAAFHEKSLLDQSRQSSNSTPFKELLIESLDEFFKASPEQTEWRGTVSQLIKMMMANPLNDFVMRSVRLEQVARYLEQIQKEGLLLGSTETGPMQTRIWVFKNHNAPIERPPIDVSVLPSPAVFSPV